MARCGYKEWKCPLDALTGERYCYWHKEEDGKEPTEEQLEELKEKEIVGVYLRVANLKKANLSGAKLQKANLEFAKLQEAKLVGANLQKARLWQANLCGADIDSAELHKADLSEANLQKTVLKFAKLQESILRDANLQETNMEGAEIENTLLNSANFQKADLRGLNLHEENLIRVNFHETKLRDANLQGANFYGAKFTSETDLDDSVLIGANLFHSYFDEAKSFRNAKVFQNGGDREINEIVGDCIDGWFIGILERMPKYMANMVTKVLKKKPNRHLHLKPCVLNVRTIELIEKNMSSIAKKLQGKGLIRYAPEGHKIIFFDWQSGCAIKNPENGLWHKDNLLRIKELADMILKDGKIQPGSLYRGSRATLYEASYEVYNNLYNFYTANSRLDQAAHVHYRRGDVHRKLKWARGGFWNRAESIFDLVILRWLAGYGDRIRNPIAVSFGSITLFAFLFWLCDGIVKNANGETVTPDWIDYIYHSITTFTSLGYSNIQPNLAVGHLPQILVAAESGLGVLMMALIIFVVTYQVSR